MDFDKRNRQLKSMLSSPSESEVEESSQVAVISTHKVPVSDPVATAFHLPPCSSLNQNNIVHKSVFYTLCNIFFDYFFKPIRIRLVLSLNEIYITADKTDSYNMPPEDPPGALR